MTTADFFRAQAEFLRAQSEHFARLATQAEEQEQHQAPEGSATLDRASARQIEPVRLDVKGCALLLNRSVSFVYRHVVPSSDLPIIPHRRLAGHLSFVAEEVKQWLEQNEVVRQAAAEETAARAELNRRVRERLRRLPNRRIGQ